MAQTINASIVTYHTDSGELRHCLSLLESAQSVATVYVIDNASDEATRLIVNEYPRAVYIPSANVGYGAAHNIALRHTLNSPTPYHLVLNTDIDFSPADLAELIDYMDAHPAIGALQPEITDRRGNPLYTVRLLPTPFDLLLRRFLPARFMRSRRERYELRHIDRSRPLNIPYHQGSFMLLRSDALREAGLFDERFFMYPEDIDLTRRIHALRPTIYYPAVTIIHDHRQASYHSPRMTRIHILNMIRYFNKWGWFHDPDRTRFNRRTLQQ